MVFSVTDLDTQKVISRTRLSSPPGVWAQMESRSGTYEILVQGRTDSDGKGTAILQVKDDGRFVGRTSVEFRADEPPLWRGEPISMNLKDADLHDVLRTFGQLTKKKVTIAPEVHGRVSMDVVGVPWDQALDVIARQNGLVITVEGDNITVNTRQ